MRLLPLLLLCFVPLPGAADAGESGTVSIVVQGLPGPGETNINAVAARSVLRAFLEENPGYDVRPFAVPEIGAADARDSGTLMAIAAGVAPDALYVNFRQSATYIEEGFLTPMEVLLARVLSPDDRVRAHDGEGRWVADPSAAEVREALALIRERIPEKSWEVVFREDLSGQSDEKHAWALPIRNLVRALFYRRDLFIEAGLDPEDPPQTWDDLLRYARALHEPERNRHAMVFSPGHGMSYNAHPFLFAGGDRAMSRREDGRWEASFDREGVARGTYYLWRLLEEPYVRDGVERKGAASVRSDRGVLWSRGQLAMIFDYLDEEMLATVSPQTVGIAPVPLSPEGRRVSELNARMLGVFAGAPPERQLAAMRYIWFITGPEARALRTQVFVENGFDRFVNPDFLREFGYERQLDRMPSSWQEAFAEAMATGLPEPYGRNTQFIYRYLSEPLNRALERIEADMEREEAFRIIETLLAEAADEVNRRMLEVLPEEERKFRNRTALVFLFFLGLAFAVGLRRIWSDFGTGGGPPSGGALWRRWPGWVLLLPAILLVLVWEYLPLAFGGAGLAFRDHKVFLPGEWVGAANFAGILFDDRFWASLAREFQYVLLMVGLGFWPPIVLAILLQEIPTTTAKVVFRTVFFLPSVLIGIVVIFLWLQMFDPSPGGTLNRLLLSLNGLGPLSATVLRLLLAIIWLSFVVFLVVLPFRLRELGPFARALLGLVAVGALAATLVPFGKALAAEGLSVFARAVGRFEMEPLGWVRDPGLAMLCVVIPSVWAASGPGCIIYLAGLKSVPDDLYEAAAIDGAGFWQRVFYIVLPRLKFLILLQLIMAVVSAFKGGESQILVMTGGGPNQATTTLSLNIFYTTFLDLEYGKGAAMAWFMGGILIAFTAYQMKLMSRSEFRTAR